MQKLKSLLKKVFTKTFFIILFVASLLCLFFFWGWFEKQYDKALGVYYVYKGDKAYKKAEMQQAIDYYNKGLELYPGHYGAHYNLGNIYVSYEDYFSAASAYERAIEENNKFSIAKMNLGIISAEKLGDFDGAIKQYQSIIDTKKNTFWIPFVFSNIKSEKTNRGLAYYNMGVAYRQKAMYLPEEEKNKTYFYLNKAVESYTKAAEILKDDYDTRYNMALAYQLMGNSKDAGLNYCKAIEIEPMNYEAHYNLAILLRHLKMYKEALTEMEKATILVTNSDSNTNTTSYIFDILNEISRALVDNNQYKYLVEKVSDTPAQTSGITYVNGKIIATEDLDKAILKNFKTCETKEFFDKYE